VIWLNGKLLCSIVLAIGFVGLLGYGFVSHAAEDIVVNTTTSGGTIVFQDNDSHGVFHIGRSSTDFRSNATFSNSIPSIETGTGRSVFTATWRNDQKNEFGSAKKATFTLTVWDPAGIPHSTTQESEGINSGTLTVSCSPFEPGEGRFELTSTIHERRLNLSAVRHR
jgi:hypothetical protein